jgi:carboxypeptidase C (cathepsin A)
VEVDEDNGSEMFYYFVESEAGGDDAPFLLWLTGGDHCSVLSGLALEIGTFELAFSSDDSPLLSKTSYHSIIMHRNCRSIPIRRRALRRHRRT